MKEQPTQPYIRPLSLVRGIAENACLTAVACKSKEEGCKPHAIAIARRHASYRTFAERGES